MPVLPRQAWGLAWKRKLVGMVVGRGRGESSKQRMSHEIHRNMDCT